MATERHDTTLNALYKMMINAFKVPQAGMVVLSAITKRDMQPCVLWVWGGSGVGCLNSVVERCPGAGDWPMGPAVGCPKRQ